MSPGLAPLRILSIDRAAWRKTSPNSVPYAISPPASLKTAKTFGLTVSPSVLTLADELICPEGAEGAGMSAPGHTGESCSLGLRSQTDTSARRSSLVLKLIRSGAERTGGCK